MEQNRISKRWTAEQIAYFITGKTNEEIAKLTGRTANACGIKRHEMTQKKLLPAKARKKYTKRTDATKNTAPIISTATSSSHIIMSVNGTDFIVSDAKTITINKGKVSINY